MAIGKTDDGRGPGGRFARGNPGGPGNPHARRVAQLRKAALDAVTEQDIRDIIGKLVDQAKAGELPAIREVLSRVLGKPDYAPDADRVEVDALKIEAEMIDARREKRLNEAADHLTY